jgi:rhodanese-related sulfurtransferase
LSRLLQQAGVDPESTVVLYGGNNNWFAAYAYWLCRYLGFDAVKLLDGGRKKWELDGREFTQDVPAFASSDFRVTGLVRGELRALRDEVLAKLGQEQFVDVRSPEEYRGERASAPEGAGAGAGPHPRSGEHPMEQGGQRRRHLPHSRRTARPLWRRGHRSGSGCGSPTAASASGQHTLGLCCMSCWATHRWRTTTAHGPSTARSLGSPSNAERALARSRSCEPRTCRAAGSRTAREPLSRRRTDRSRRSWPGRNGPHYPTLSVRFGCTRVKQRAHRFGAWGRVGCPPVRSRLGHAARCR